MKKNLLARKRLSLSTETVRQLQDPQLRGAVGGYGYTSYNPTWCACPPKPTQDPEACTTSCPQ